MTKAVWLLREGSCHKNFIGTKAIRGTMDKMDAFLNRLRHSPILRLTAVMLVALAWSSPAFCGEIHDAARDGDLKKVKALLKGNPDLISSKGNNGTIPLHVAAMHGHKDAAALLLANHAAVNAKDNCGATPLHYAVGGREETSKLLGKDAYDLVFPDKPGLKTDLKDVAELLRQHGGLK